METRRIGSLEVSTVGIGCNNFGWKIDEAGTSRVVDAALGAGITFFDTADTYGGTKSEEFLGNAIRGRREEVVIATKFGSKVDEERQGASPDYIHRAVDDSLRRLGVEYIDLYQLHRPDPTVPLSETMGALDEVVRAGKVREIGCSNFSAGQLRESVEIAGNGAAGFASVQNEYSLLKREPESEVLPECERDGIAFLPFFPLASGLLTGKYRKGEEVPEGTRISGGGSFGKLLTDGNLDMVEALISFSESRNHTILDLAFSWLLSRSSVSSVIAGATSPEQVKSNAAAAGWTLTDEERSEVEKIVAGNG